ncbi:MAG: hypothetical protein JWS12_21 [Candidatus Saccharibacteria bacterium]|nr:hypothetical protein [Candidatus Saccharibacteria bacterium]
MEDTPKPPIESSESTEHKPVTKGRRMGEFMADWRELFLGQREEDKEKKEKKKKDKDQKETLKDGRSVARRLLEKLGGLAHRRSGETGASETGSFLGGLFEYGDAKDELKPRQSDSQQTGEWYARSAEPGLPAAEQNLPPEPASPEGTFPYAKAFGLEALSHIDDEEPRSESEPSEKLEDNSTPKEPIIEGGPPPVLPPEVLHRDFVEERPVAGYEKAPEPPRVEHHHHHESKGAALAALISAELLSRRRDRKLRREDRRIKREVKKVEKRLKQVERAPKAEYNRPPERFRAQPTAASEKTPLRSSSERVAATARPQAEFSQPPKSSEPRAPEKLAHIVERYQPHRRVEVPNPLEQLKPEARLRPEEVLHTIEQAAEHDIPVEAAYELRHEIKDEPQQQYASHTATPGQFTATNVPESTKDMAALGSQMQDQRLRASRSDKQIYGQAVRGGFWAAVIIAFLIVVVLLLK